jgi:hypothetical protein
LWVGVKVADESDFSSRTASTRPKVSRKVAAF